MKSLIFLSMLMTLLFVSNGRMVLHYNSKSSANHDQIVNVKEFANIANLDANNWVLGNITLDEYYSKRFEIVKNSNTSQCPIATPFVFQGSNDCQACPESTPIFSLSNDTCIPCPKGQQFDHQLGFCKLPTTKPTPSPTTQTTSPNNSVLTPMENLVNITNLEGDDWILGNLTIDQYYSKRFQITSKHNTSLCPKQTPYVLKGKTICEQCPISAPIFSLENDTCIPCPKGETFDNATHTCHDPNIPVIPPSNSTPNSSSPVDGVLINVSGFINVTNLDGDTWIYGNLTKKEYDLQRFAITSEHNTSLCDASTPYVIAGHGGICQPCPKDKPIFVLQNSTCIPPPQPPQQPQNITASCDTFEECGSGQYFNYEQNRCQFCQFGQYFDGNYQACLFCPQQKPFLDSTHNCAKCPVDKKINRTINQCL